MRQRVPGKVTARLTDDQKAALERVADSHSSSISSAARMAIHAGLRLIDAEYQRSHA